MVMEAQPAVMCFDKNKKNNWDGDRELLSHFRWKVKVRTSKNILARCKIKGHQKSRRKICTLLFPLFNFFFKKTTFRSKDLRQANTYKQKQQLNKIIDSF